MTVLNGETVVLVRRTLTSRDGYGNDVYEPAPVTVDGCVVWPRSSTEDTTAADRITSGLAVLLPAGTDASAIDAVIARGAQYEVEGEPAVYKSPFSSTDPGVLINLTRVTG